MPVKKTTTKKIAAANKTAQELPVIEDVIEQVELKEIVPPLVQQQLLLAAEISSVPKRSHPARPLPQANEQYDLNVFVGSGVIRSVWAKIMMSLPVSLYRKAET